MISRVCIILVSFKLIDHEITGGQSPSYTSTIVKFINNTILENVRLFVEKSDLALLLQDLEVLWSHKFIEATLL
jgi:hypothetical protein